MNHPPLPLWILILAIVLFLSGGCAQTPPPAPARSSQATPPVRHDRVPGKEIDAEPQDTLSESVRSHQRNNCTDSRLIRDSEKNRAGCYQLRPATVVAKKKRTTNPSPSKKKKKRKNSHKTAIATPTTTGLCQPQSLVYARCRTGITTCRLGNTSPVQWLACARTMGNTTATPTAGSIMVLDGNARRKMPTGHPVYVEEAARNNDSTWTLRISHTNYDRKCHLDPDARVLYDPRSRTASFQSGPWGPWANGLNVLGFILR